jgi:Ca2+-transporting ATPase
VSRDRLGLTRIDSGGSAHALDPPRVMVKAEPLGLTTAEAARRFATHGPNALPEARPTPPWLRFVRQLRSPLIYILLFAVAFDVAVWFYDQFEGLPVEGIVIAIIVLLNAGLGTFQEHRSEQALAKLRSLTAPSVWVLRDGKLARVPSTELVPGDVVRVEAGERVPADGTCVDGEGVMVDEAVLTGESVPVEKDLGAPLSSGTLLVRGKGFLEVDATGEKSAMGRIAAMLGEIRPEKTPLERRLAKVANQLAVWIGGLAALLVVAGAITEGVGRIDEVVMFSVALAVAAIPEGMPAVVTLTLALGVQRMAKHQALVRRLSAVESLGSVTVIATDKTGTLTEEKMEVRDLVTDEVNETAATCAMVIANDADVEAGAGDPLDLGLLAFARERGIDPSAVRHEHVHVEARPFDSAWKYMRVTTLGPDGRASWLKGAPEVILARCRFSDEARAAWMERAEREAQRGYKVIALAKGHEEEDLAFLGLVTLWDPPRREVALAIATAQRAGVRVLMITGDHPGTARAVAAEIGIPEPKVLTGAEIDTLSAEDARRAVRSANVFARVTPAHKLRLVEALRADGQIVAMTGDGVNDAPALKRADVGIAMGRRGSDVSREVADLVLLDDNFATIVRAIEEGRGIYENIQTFIRFTFSTNVALMVLVVTGAVVAHVRDLREPSGMLLLPLTALQLLWINFLGDGPPALALALDRPPGQMDRPPRPPSSALLDRASAIFIATTGLFKGALGIALLMLLPEFGIGLIATQTVIFLYESIGKLVSVYPSRLARHRNWTLHASIVIGVLVQAATIAVPGLRRFLGLALLDRNEVTIVASAVMATWAVAAIVRWVLTRRRTTPHARLRMAPAR